MMNPVFILPFASFEDVAMMVPLFAITLVPIVAILTRHQQKMASIVNQNADRAQPLPSAVDQQILSELSSLRQLANQQMIMIDDLSRAQQDLKERVYRSNSSESEITSRLSSVKDQIG